MKFVARYKAGIGGIMTMLRLAKKIIMRMKDDFTNYSKKKNGTIITTIMMLALDTTIVKKQLVHAAIQ